MVYVQILKFGQNKKLLDILLSTGNAILAEAYPYDRIWGIGMSSTDASCKSPSEWKEQNLLGSALMETRRRLLPE